MRTKSSGFGLMVVLLSSFMSCSSDSSRNLLEEEAINVEQSDSTASTSEESPEHGVQDLDFGDDWEQ
jgi:uncharacterized OsmC-like protein